MKPGPELDVFVHETVLDLCAHHWSRDGHGDETTCSKCDAPHRLTACVSTPEYSTDMGAAWQVVEKERLGGALISIHPQPDGSWIVTNEKALNPNFDGTADGWDETYPETSVRVASPAHGICLVSVHLDEEVMAEYVVDCIFCGERRASGHAPECPFPGMRPNLQEYFRKERP